MLKGRIPFPYVRVSSKPQGRDDRYGPKTQTAVAEAVVKILQLPAIRRFYEDHISGRHAEKRVEFLRLLDDAKAAGRGKAVILAYDVSRWARNETDAHWYMEQATKANIPILFIADDLLTIYSAGDWRSRFAALAQEAAALSRTISRKVRDANAMKWSSDGWHGGLPYGYRRTPDKKTIEVDPATIRQRVAVFRLFASGKFPSANELAAHLRAKKIRFGDKDLTAAGIRVLLRNPVVIGTLRYQQAAPPDRPDEKPALKAREKAVNAALDMKTWNTVQQLLDDHSLGYGNGDGIRVHTYAFAGAPGSGRGNSLAYCMECEERYYAHTDARGNRRLVHRTDRGCRRGVRGEYKLVRTLEQWFATWSLPKDAATRLARLSARPKEDVAKNVDAEVKRLEREFKSATNAYTSGKLGDEAFAAILQKFQQEKRQALMGAVIATPTVVALPNFQKLLPALANLRKAPIELQHELVGELFERVWLGKQSLKVKVKPEYAPLVRLAQGLDIRKGPDTFEIASAEREKAA